MTMLKSHDQNLFTSIFPERSQYASLIIKFLLVLDTENVVPLFEVKENSANNLDDQGIFASVVNNHNQIESVKNIISQFVPKINPLTLFFGSNFKLELSENIPNSNINKSLTFNSFLVFTQQGLILEYPEIYQNSLNHYFSHHWQSGQYNLLLWKNWQDVSLNFAQEEPECTMIFKDIQGRCLKISYQSQYQSEAQQIEEQLPLVFCYFIMKIFWKYIEKIHYNSVSVFHSDDFLYLNQDRLNYFKKQVLANINISEKDLEALVKKIENN